DRSRVRAGRTANGSRSAGTPGEACPRLGLLGETDRRIADRGTFCADFTDDCGVHAPDHVPRAALLGWSGVVVPAERTDHEVADVNELVTYRDDGPFATLLGKLFGNSPTVSAPLVTLTGGIVLAGSLVAVGQGIGLLIPAVGIVAYVLLAGGVAGRDRVGRLDWLVPPMLRAAEYGTLLVLALLAEPTEPRALPACFLLLAVLAYNHYNITYRLRHQNAAPPRWLRYVGDGWDLRLLVAFALFAAGLLAVGMYVLAGVLAVLHVVETVISWSRGTYAYSGAVDEIGRA